MDGSTCPCLGLLSTSRGRLLVVVGAGDGAPGKLNRQPSLRADLASRTPTLSTFPIRNFMRLCVACPTTPSPPPSLRECPIRKREYFISSWEFVCSQMLSSSLLCRLGVPFRKPRRGKESKPMLLLFMRHNQSYLCTQNRHPMGTTPVKSACNAAIASVARR